MTQSILFTKDFDVSKITYDEPRKLDNGGKMIYVSYKKAPIRIQTPECYVPFGINIFKNEDTQTEVHSLDISFDGKDKNPNLNDFFNKMKSFDEINLKKGFENQQNWLKKKFPSIDVLDALYTTMIKYPKDKNGDISKEWAPTFKLKLPMKNGEYKFEMYDKKNERIPVNKDETKGSRVAAIIKCNGIWIAGGKFGMSWNVEQIQIKPPNRISGFAFRDSPEDMIQEDSLSMKVEPDEEAVTNINEVISDSDDDELEPVTPEKVDEPESEPEPEPEVKPVKKKVTKKKATI